MFDFYVQKMVMVGCGRHYHPYKIYGRTRRRENTDPRRLGKEVYYLSEDLLRILQGQGVRWLRGIFQDLKKCVLRKTGGRRSTGNVLIDEAIFCELSFKELTLT